MKWRVFCRQNFLQRRSCGFGGCRPHTPPLRNNPCEVVDIWLAPSKFFTWSSEKISFLLMFFFTPFHNCAFIYTKTVTRQKQRKKEKPGWIRCFWGWCLLPAVLESTAPKLLLPRSPLEIAINSEIYTGKAVQVLIESSAPHSQPPGKELSGAWLTALHLSLSSL